MAPFWKRKGAARAEPNVAGTESVDPMKNTKATRSQPVELGTIEYCNITQDGRHGDYDIALTAAAKSGKPLFANFVEWSG